MRNKSTLDGQPLKGRLISKYYGIAKAIPCYETQVFLRSLLQRSFLGRVFIAYLFIFYFPGCDEKKAGGLAAARFAVLACRVSSRPPARLSHKTSKER